jgi:hypothetical protein
MTIAGSHNILLRAMDDALLQSNRALIARCGNYYACLTQDINGLAIGWIDGSNVLRPFFNFETSANRLISTLSTTSDELLVGTRTMEVSFTDKKLAVTYRNASIDSHVCVMTYVTDSIPDHPPITEIDVAANNFVLKNNNYYQELETDGVVIYGAMVDNVKHPLVTIDYNTKVVRFVSPEFQTTDGHFVTGTPKAYIDYFHDTDEQFGLEIFIQPSWATSPISAAKILYNQGTVLDFQNTLVARVGTRLKYMFGRSVTDGVEDSVQDPYETISYKITDDYTPITNLCITTEGTTTTQKTEHMFGYTLKAPSITFEGTLTNVYTKAEVDAKIPGGGNDLTVNGNLYIKDEGIRLYQSTDGGSCLNFDIDDGGTTLSIKDHHTTISGVLDLNNHVIDTIWATADNYASWNDNMLVPAGVVKTKIDALSAPIEEPAANPSSIIQTISPIYDFTENYIGRFAKNNEGQPNTDSPMCYINLCLWGDLSTDYGNIMGIIAAEDKIITHGPAFLRIGTTPINTFYTGSLLVPTQDGCKPATDQEKTDLIMSGCPRVRVITNDLLSQGLVGCFIN